MRSEAPDDRIYLRSYRLAFELERRIHRIDGFRIPLPYGLPLAALGWAAATLIAVLMLGGAPIVGAMLALLPMPVRLVFLPGAVAHLLCRTTADGRPVHEALAARGAFVVRPRRRLGFEAAHATAFDLAGIPVVPDERGENYRAGTVAGAGDVALRMPGEIAPQRAGGRLTPGDAQPLYEPRRLRLHEGQRLVVA